MSATYMIDGKPHRICDCDEASQVCPMGRKRELQTCGFNRCLVPTGETVIAHGDGITITIAPPSTRSASHG